jgi:hypothetical protein
MSARGMIVSLYIGKRDSGTYILPLSPITGSQTKKKINVENYFLFTNTTLKLFQEIKKKV